MKNQARTIVLPVAVFFALLFCMLTAAAAKPPATSKPVALQNSYWLPDKQLILNLYTVTAGNTEVLDDGLFVAFNDGYLASTSDDIGKLMNFGENISSYREKKDLIVERRPLIINMDTIFLHFTNAATTDYRFKINLVNFAACGLVATIQDNFTNQTMNLKMDGTITNIDFSVTAEPASADPYRFKLLFSPAAVLPLTLTGFTAAWQGKQVVLGWQVSNQLNMRQYDVERSTNGSFFSRINTQAVIGNNGSNASYSWADVQPAAGNSFYRIRCIGIDGDITFSPVIGIKAGSNADISIYPNPVSHGSFALQLTGMQKGNYLLRLFNNSGQVVFTKTVNHNGSNSTYAIIPGNSIVKGNYYLQLDGAATVIRKQLMVVE